jgi:hypothetical protein
MTNEEVASVDSIMKIINENKDSPMPRGEITMHKLEPQVSAVLMSYLNQYELIEAFTHTYSNSGGGLQPVSMVKLSKEGHEVILKGGFRKYKKRVDTRKWYENIKLKMGIISILFGILLGLSGLGYQIFVFYKYNTVLTQMSYVEQRMDTLEAKNAKQQTHNVSKPPTTSLPQK